MRWRLIDHIVQCEPGVSAVGLKTFPTSDEFFQDHFPGMPIVPGVLQIEMIAQMAGKCVAMSLDNVLPVLGNVKGAKFYKNVRPEDECHIKITVTKVAKSYSMAEGHIEVAGEKVSSASLLFGHVPRTNLADESFDTVTQEWLQSQKKNP